MVTFAPFLSLYPLFVWCQVKKLPDVRPVSLGLKRDTMDVIVIGVDFATDPAKVMCWQVWNHSHFNTSGRCRRSRPNSHQ